MTVWNIHLLNARNDLTRIMPQLRATLRDAVARTQGHADLPRFDLIVRAGGDVIPEWGIGGHAPAPGLIQISLNPDRFDSGLMLRTLVHEFHHLIRWDGPGYGKSLGEALVSEGLAGSGRKTRSLGCGDAGLGGGAGGDERMGAAGL